MFRFYLNQKKTLEINPRHPLMKELLKRVEDETTDDATTDLAQVLYDTAVLRYNTNKSVCVCLFIGAIRPFCTGSQFLCHVYMFNCQCFWAIYEFLYVHVHVDICIIADTGKITT